MAVTAVKAVVNARGGFLEVKDHEEPAKPGHFLAAIPFGQAAPCDMWIPWCNSAEMFLGAHYITIGQQFTQPTFYWLYQRDEKVMYQELEWWKDAAKRPVPGYSDVGGDRVLVVNSAGLFLSKVGL